MLAKLIKDINGFDLNIKQIQKDLSEGLAYLITREALTQADTNQLLALSSLVDREIVDNDYLALVKHFKNQKGDFYKDLKVDGFNRIGSFDRNGKATPLYRYQVRELLLKHQQNGVITFTLDIPYVYSIKALRVIAAKLIGAISILSVYEECSYTTHIEYVGEYASKARDKSTADEVVITYFKKRQVAAFVLKINSYYISTNDIQSLYYKYKGKYQIILNGKPVYSAKPKELKVEKPVKAELDSLTKTYKDSALADYINRKAVALWIANKGYVKVDEEEYKITGMIAKDFFPLSLTKDGFAQIVEKLMLEFNLQADAKRFNTIKSYMQREGRFIQVSSLNKSNNEGKELVDQVPDPQTNGGC